MNHFRDIHRVSPLEPLAYVPEGNGPKDLSLASRRRPSYIRKTRFLSFLLQGGGWAAMSIDPNYTFVKTRCWERLKAGGEGNDRGLDGWMASATQQTF